MPAEELMQWAAFEQVYGPVLVQERIDIGFARLSYYLVSLLGRKRRLKVRDFLPKYLNDLVTRRSSSSDELRAFFEGLTKPE